MVDLLLVMVDHDTQYLGSSLEANWSDPDVKDASEGVRCYFNKHICF